jgi:uncharacterized protein YprB with RNaseH-like and TPR domain
MLKNTFLHIPGIGYKTEQRLWRHGYVSWQDYLERCESCPVSAPAASVITGWLGESERALREADVKYFETVLSSGDAWRFYAEFRDNAAFVDIETTGLWGGADAITVIGLFDGVETKVFIKGKNLDDFADEVKKYALLVTFNGKRFDLPFIRSAFGDLPDLQGHIDIMYPLRRLGYRGGLKRIEAELGLDREGALKQVDGYLAVLLWREYRRGNKAALDTLIRYNLEDVVNLQYLADLVYNEASARLPIEVQPLPRPAKYVVDVPFDEELVEWLSQAIEEGKDR